MVESRSKKGIANIKCSLFFYIVNLFLNIISRKVFIDYLGIEVLGLNTTVTNLLSFLNLAELGIGNAIAFTLYKPLFLKDFQVIREIVSVQAWLYRRIAYFISIGALGLMLLFPVIFKKIDLPLWYAYATFIVLLIASLLSYFVNYKQILLSADQKEYKITLCVQGIKSLKTITRVVVILYLINGYVYWLTLELVGVLVSALLLNKIVNKEYPWLFVKVSDGKKLRNKYPEIIVKTKQFFFHRISSFVLNQTSPLIIYAFASLTMVAIYGNYMLIVFGGIALVNAFFNGFNAGVGNLVAEGDKKKIKSFFWEITSFRIWIAAIICVCFFKLCHPFISLWVGKEYVLDEMTFIVLTIYVFISLTRVNEAFLFAYGLYQDIWAPIIEAILNLGLSVLLGFIWGLTGIISGVVISLVVIVCIWKPYFLFKMGFKDNILEYVSRYIKYYMMIALSFILSHLILNTMFIDFQSSYWKLFEYACTVGSCYAILSFLFFYLFDNGMRQFTRRLLNIFLK